MKRRFLMQTWRTAIGLVAFGIISVPGLYAQAPGEDTSGNSVSGAVTNSVTGAPVAGALVELNGEKISRAMLTDHEGRFLFADLPRGRASLSATKPGFFSAQELSEGSVMEQTVDAGPDTPPSELRLVPEAVIAGHIVNSQGAPLEGVRVRITHIERLNGRQRLEGIQQGDQPEDLLTDDQGEYRMASLKPGVYYVTSLTFADSEEGLQAYPTTYYPGVAEFSEASPVELAPGRQAQLDFTLSAVPVVNVAGRVTGCSPGQTPEIQFLNQSGDNLSLGARYDPKTGRFDGKVVAAAPFVVSADVRDTAERQLFAQAMLNPGQDASGIQLDLVPTFSIRVAVRSDMTRPHSNSDLDPPASVQLHPLELDKPEISADLEGDANHRSLILRHVPAGRYHVEVTPAKPSWYVKSARAGSADLIQEPLDVGTGQSPALEIVLGDDGASLSATVDARAEGSAAYLFAVPSSAPNAVRVATAPPDGELRIEGLAPGEYKVFALDRTDGLDYSDPSSFSGYLSEAVSVNLRPNDYAAVHVEMIRRGE